MTKASAKGYLLSKKTGLNLDKNLVQITSSDQLPAQGCHMVIFDFEAPDINDALVTKLRSQAPYRYLPFFAYGKASDAVMALLDGVYDAQALQKAADIQERLALCLANDQKFKIAPDDDASLDAQLMLARYAFIRKNCQLKAELSYSNPYGFTYPILQALLPEGSANDHWYVLNSLVKRGYLIETAVYNELQTCPGCEAGLLNFKNCCPNCESVDLHVEPFVHCFTCGNVGPVREFMRHQNLVCPRCQSNLKHIGIDYDKPLEDKICENCQHRFFEPNTLYVCLVCEKVGHPEDLNTRKLNQYQLTPKGKAFAKNELQQLLVDIGAFFEVINFRMLQFIIDWQAKISERHSDIEFLVGVIFVDQLDAMIDDLGF